MESFKIKSPILRCLLSPEYFENIEELNTAEQFSMALHPDPIYTATVENFVYNRAKGILLSCTSEEIVAAFEEIGAYFRKASPIMGDFLDYMEACRDAIPEGSQLDVRLMFANMENMGVTRPGATVGAFAVSQMMFGAHNSLCSYCKSQKILTEEEIVAAMIREFPEGPQPM